MLSLFDVFCDREFNDAFCGQRVKDRIDPNTVRPHQILRTSIDHHIKRREDDPLARD
jgi:hypothetical protein